jgi:hypothetical protein
VDFKEGKSQRLSPWEARSPVCHEWVVRTLNTKSYTESQGWWDGCVGAGSQRLLQGTREMLQLKAPRTHEDREAGLTIHSQGLGPAPAPDSCPCPGSAIWVMVDTTKQLQKETGSVATLCFSIGQHRDNLNRPTRILMAISL